MSWNLYDHRSIRVVINPSVVTGGKQRPNLFNKHLCFELTGLTCCFSLAWKREGFTVKTSGMASTAVKQWSELSAVVWVLRSCSFHGHLVHIYNTTVFMNVFATITWPGWEHHSGHDPWHVENILIFSRSSWGALSDRAYKLQPRCDFSSYLQYYTCYDTYSYVQASAWGWRRWPAFWWVVRFVHICSSKATHIVQEPLRPGKWLAEDVGGSGGQTDWFSACFMKY